MSLKEQLFADLKTAMKEKDTIKKDTIQTEVFRFGLFYFPFMQKIPEPKRSA